MAHQRMTVNAQLVAFANASQNAAVRLESGTVEIPVVNERSRMQQFTGRWRSNLRQLVHLTLEERAEIVAFFHETNECLVVLSLSEHLTL